MSLASKTYRLETSNISRNPSYLGVPGLGGEARSQPMPLRPADAVVVALESAILLARRTDLLTRGRIGMATGNN